jgi:ribosomal protein S13
LNINKNLKNNNFGISKSTIEKLHKMFGLNLRKSPKSIKKDNKDKINLFLRSLKLGRELKENVYSNINMKKKIGAYKNSVVTNKTKKKNAKKKLLF